MEPGGLKVLLILMALSTPLQARPPKVWRLNCMSCHGATGEADTDLGKALNARNLTLPEVQDAITEESIRNAILHGLKGEDGTVLMPGFEVVLKPEEVDELIAYVRTLRIPQTPDATP